LARRRAERENPQEAPPNVTTAALLKNGPQSGLELAQLDISALP
jgi:hypothetical protein